MLTIKVVCDKLDRLSLESSSDHRKNFLKKRLTKKSHCDNIMKLSRKSIALKDTARTIKSQ